MNAGELRDRLQKRLAALQRQRVEQEQQAAAQLARLDVQIAAVRDLAQRWDTLTLPEALQALEDTGIRVQVD